MSIPVSQTPCSREVFGYDGDTGPLLKNVVWEIERCAQPLTHLDPRAQSWMIPMASLAEPSVGASQRKLN